jgi:sulfotransferase
VPTGWFPVAFSPEPIDPEIPCGGPTTVNKIYHFVSGMPRSGSTLLMNILGQNPRFHVTGTSGVLDLIFGLRNNWEKHPEFQAAPDEAAKIRVMRGILDSFYANVEAPIVFDKSRGWLSLLEMAEMLLQRKAKVLVPVRDLRDILASFEKLWRETSKIAQVPQEAKFYHDYQTVEGRCAVLARGDQVVGLAYNRIKDALQRGFRDRMHFVHYEKLTAEPEKTLRAIYEFLEEPYFPHDFDNVKQITWENDEVYGIKGLHNIRSKVEPVKSRHLEILGAEVANLYKPPYPWTGK